MPQSADMLATIDLFYRAAMQPDLWPEALEKFARAVGCIGMAMIPITPNDTTGLVVSPAMRDVQDEYEQGWCVHDSRVGRIFSRRLSNGVVCEPQLFADEEVARDPFRQEFCRKWGIGVFAAQLVEPWPGQVVAFSAQRGIERGHFDGQDIETLTLLGRHAARALLISQKLAASEELGWGLLEIIDRFAGGVFVLNGAREVELANACAERMLGDGLVVTKRRLFASASDRQPALDALIASTFDAPRTTVRLKPIALPRPSGRRPLLAQALPLSSDYSGSERKPDLHAPRGGLLLVVDPETSIAGSEDCLRLFGLTSAEARLAALVGSGMRRHAAAAMLGISDWTANTTLKHIYAKLEIASQGELVRLVGRTGAVAPL